MAPVALREKDLSILRVTLSRFGFVRRVRIFGSRVAGTAHRASDLDLAIEAPDASPGEWLDLCEALEEAPLIYELDLVRDERIANPKLREKVEREGVTVYSGAGSDAAEAPDASPETP